MSYTRKEKTDIINDMIIDVITNVSQVSDINVGSVLRTLIESLGDELDLTYEELESIYNGTRILTATGDDLDNLGAIVGVTRTAGTNATTTVTFSRETIASSDFTITSGSVLSTNPAEGTQYNFTVDSDITFDAVITESVDYADGVWYYPLTERLIGEVDSLTGTASSSPATFTLNTDFKITEIDGVYLPEEDSLTTIDSCDAVTGWSASTDAIAEATGNTASILKEGSNYLKLGKNGTASNVAYYYKTLSSSLDLNGKRVFIWLYVVNSTALNKIDSINLRISTDTTPTNNYYTLPLSNLATGMNLYSVDYSGASQVGFPNIENINSIRIDIATNNNSDTLTSGDIIMDFWHASESTQYYGDVIEWIYTGTKPDDSTSFTVNWKPLSVDGTATAEAVGTDYNVSANSLVYKVDLFPNISALTNYISVSNGSNEEDDDGYRTRIQNAAASAGKATSEAIRQAILAVEGVQSVNIEDLPITDIYGTGGGVNTTESHVMDTASGEQALDYEVVYLDDATTPTNIIIADAINDTSADYTYGTSSDYYVDVDNNKIIWDTTTPGTTCPSNGATYYVGYQVEWLGHVQVYVAGTSNTIPTSVSDNIDAAIEASKAAGITVTWAAATVSSINITCTVTVDTDAGYDSTTVKENVQAAVINWLNGKDIGSDVLVAKFYDTVMDIAGVSNVVITDWDGDTSAPFSDITIGTNEVARPEDGGIVVN